MLSADRLEQFLAEIRDLPHPVLSLYAETAEPGGGNLEDATRIRVSRSFAKLREAHDELAAIESRIIDAMGSPAGRGTVAIFAGPADREKPQIIARNLPTVLPIGTNGLTAEGRFGAPWLDPLRLALSETTRVGVIHVHDQGVRLYEVFLDEIEPVLDLTPPEVPGEDDHLQISKTIHPAHIADRGSSGRDDADAHLYEWRRRFYEDAANDLLPILDTRRIDDVLVLGTAKNRQLFGNLAPARLRNRQFAEAPSLPQQDARPARILAAVREHINNHVLRRRADLMQALQERPVLGLDDCLTKLQQGALELLFIPWDLDATLYEARETGHVASTPGQARALSPSPDVPVIASPARSKLIELADAHATDIQFTRSGASDSPFDAVKGVAGVPRWTT